MKLRRMNGIMALLLCLLLIIGSGTAEELHLEEKSLELMDCSVHYPTVLGLEDQELQSEINSRIIESAGIQDYLTRTSQLIGGGSLQVSWTGGLLGDVFSCAVSAQGNIDSSRETHRWTWATVDLRNGKSIRLEDLTEEEAGLRDLLERFLEEKIEPGLSAHLPNGSLTPLPEGFYLTETGLILLYPADQMMTLSGKAGAVRVPWCEIEPALDRSEDGIPVRCGAIRMLTLSPSGAEALREQAGTGALPDVPAAIGDPLQPLTENCGLLNDPDLYAGGRMFALEGALFQDCFVLTDGLSESWENSVVQGIRMDRGCLYGLRIGQTDRAEWLDILGEPDRTVTLEGDLAEQWRVEEGTCDYYSCGEYQLQLFADESGVLRTLILAE